MLMLNRRSVDVSDLMAGSHSYLGTRGMLMPFQLHAIVFLKKGSHPDEHLQFLKRDADHLCQLGLAGRLPVLALEL